MKARDRAIWILVSGPSGVGKTTLIEQMLGNYFPRLQSVVTATTRMRRAGEENGRQYFFMSSEEFVRKEKAGEFLETVERHGAMYGTLKSEIQHKLEAQRDLIMHIDWKGKRKLESLARHHAWLQRAIVSVFVKPGSMVSLRRRLERRGRNTRAEILMRLREAKRDMTHAEEYDYVFASGSYEQDLYRMKAIYAAEKIRLR